MMPRWRRIKPGWYLLAAVMVYGLAVTVVLARQGKELAAYRQSFAAGRAPVASLPGEAVETGLWFPLPGARVPAERAHLPGSQRPYRRGVSEGFDFYDGDSGIPVPYGAPVIAAASGTVERVDHAFVESDPADWARLMEAVAAGADDAQLDRLRGRQVWLLTDSGMLIRYAHLSAVREGLAKGQRVERGWVVGFVGNSGTDEGVAGTTRGARLHFEIWSDGSFFGEGMGPDEVRIEAASLFTGP
jgi:murein DD-endopeptidase MepM/ murein hydrolase activator NlpD